MSDMPRTTRSSRGKSLPGIARLAVMWALPVILTDAWITARGGAGSPA